MSEPQAPVTQAVPDYVGVSFTPGRFAVPKEFQAVVLRCLEKDPARRFQTADSLGKALAECPEALFEHRQA